MTNEQEPNQKWAELLGDELRDLIARMRAAGIAEMELQQGETRLRVKRGSPAVAAAPISTAAELSHQPETPAVAPAAPSPIQPGRTPLLLPPAPVLPHIEAPERPSRHHAITSPLVGTFYDRPAPEKSPFVHVEQLIQRGQPIGTIEAMKMFNEIQSDVAGRVVTVLVENGQPVEYGQPLMIVELPA